MSENGRRRTRSQTAHSRTQTPEAQAAGHEPQAPASIRSNASIRRSATKKPLLDTETSNTYGSQGEKVLAQQLSAQEAMNKAVNTIQNELAGAEAGPSRRLSTVNEEEAGDEQGSVVDRSNVSGKGKERLTIQLTQMKSFHREVLLQSEDSFPPRDDASEGSFPPRDDASGGSIRPRDDASGGSVRPRDDASDRHLPGVHDNSVLARLRARLVMYTPILEMLLLSLMAVIAFLLMAMWVGWRPLDGSLPAGEYNKSYVSGEFVKMTHVLQGESRQIGERLESQLRDRLGERLEGQARLLEERMEGHDRLLGERMEGHDRLLGERMEGHERRLQERLQSQERHLAERIGELIQEQDQRLDVRWDEEHREIGKIRDDLESVAVKLHHPMASKSITSLEGWPP